MKRNIAAYAAASIFALAIPAAAAQHAHSAADAQCERECQMLARNCGQETDTLQGKISRLQGEIRKGSAVYAQDELDKLEMKLKDAQEALEGTQRS